MKKLDVCRGLALLLLAVLAPLWVPIAIVRFCWEIGGVAAVFLGNWVERNL